MLQSQRHRIMGDSVDKIGRAIQRINDPTVFGLAERVAGKLIFFAEHGMVWKGPQNGRLDHFLGGEIRLGDEVCRPFCRTLVLPIQSLIVAPAARTAFSHVSRYNWSSLMDADYIQSPEWWNSWPGEEILPSSKKFVFGSGQDCET